MARRTRQRRGSPATSVLPFVALLLLAGGAIAVAGWVNGVKRAEARAEAERAEKATHEAEKADPFATVPDERPPRSKSDPAYGWGDTAAPEGLLADPVWIQARALADRGVAYGREALEAKEREDYAEYNAKGTQAREAFDEALEATAEWELGLIEKYGDTDEQVRKIVRARSDWFDQLKKFRKTR